MLELIEGALTSTAREGFNALIKKSVEGGRRTYLIVPEQQTVIAEAEMSALLPDSAPLIFEVTNFTRLANTVFRALGGVAARYCDKTTRHLIMWKTLTELSPTLSLTRGKREVSPGTVERALTAVLEMQSLGVGAGELSEVLEGVGETEKRLREKLSDLAKIMSLYRTLFTESYTDASEDVDVMNKKVRQNPDYFKDTDFFITGFSSFTEPQYRFIVTLAEVAELKLHLTLPRHAEDSYEYTEILAAREKITRLADRAGVKKRLTRIDTPDEKRAPALREAVELIWHTGAKIDNESLQSDPPIRIFEAESTYDECDFIAADIRGRVTKGALWRDFAIIMRDVDRYRGILDTSLKKYSIPAFISKKEEVSAHEPIKLIYSALAVITGGYRLSDVITYAKCTPGDLTRDECDLFELYCETWQINGHRFTDGEAWNMSPDGYTVRHGESESEELIKINEIKTRLITPLLELEHSVSRAKTVRDYATALVEFLTKISLAEDISRRAETLAALGEAEAAADNLALWGVITDSLDALVSVLGDCECDAESFISELKVVFSGADIGRIPTYLDGVTVGSADMLRLYGKKHIYIIGVNRGEFPLAPSEGSYFSDRDKRTLSEAGLAIEPDLDYKRARELYYFSRALSYAKESATLSYSTLNSSYGQSARSEAITRLIELTNGAISPRKISDIPELELIFSPESALESLGKFDTDTYEGVKKTLTGLGYGEELLRAERSVENSELSLSEGALALIYGDEVPLTQSRIDSYVSCPMSYFCRYNLSLTEEERAEFDARNIGSFVHALLESFFMELSRRGLNPKELSDKEITSLLQDSAQRYYGLLGVDFNTHSKREQLMLARLIRATRPVVDGICHELSLSGFRPKYFELRIDRESEGLPEAARFTLPDGKSVYVYGSIDRVDTYKCGDRLYVRVVDYKTGQKVFSPSDIDKGKNLQMFLYLKSIIDTKNEKFLSELGVEEGKKPIPAGVIYVKTELGDVKIDEPDESLARDAILAAQKRFGMVLDEPEVMGAIPPDYNPASSQRSADKRFSADGWELLSERLSRAVCDVASRMTGGEIAAKPHSTKAGESPCEYCGFKAVCRNVKK